MTPAAGEASVEGGAPLWSRRGYRRRVATGIASAYCAGMLPIGLSALLGPHPEASLAGFGGSVFVAALWWVRLRRQPLLEAWPEGMRWAGEPAATWLVPWAAVTEMRRSRRTLGVVAVDTLICDRTRCTFVDRKGRRFGTTWYDAKRPLRIPVGALDEEWQAGPILQHLRRELTAST